MNSTIIEYAKNKNLIITEEGLRLLNIDNYKNIIDKLELENKVFIKPEEIRKVIVSTNYKNPENTVNLNKSNFIF